MAAPQSEAYKILIQLWGDQARTKRQNHKGRAATPCITAATPCITRQPVSILQSNVDKVKISVSAKHTPCAKVGASMHTTHSMCWFTHPRIVAAILTGIYTVGSRRACVCSCGHTWRAGVWCGGVSGGVQQLGGTPREGSGKLGHPRCEVGGERPWWAVCVRRKGQSWRAERALNFFVAISRMSKAPSEPTDKAGVQTLFKHCSNTYTTLQAGKCLNSDLGWCSNV